MPMKKTHVLFEMQCSVAPFNIWRQLETDLKKSVHLVKLICLHHSETFCHDSRTTFCTVSSVAAEEHKHSCLLV